MLTLILVMIDSAHAYSLEKAGDWDALFELVSSWPSVQAKHWYLGNYYYYISVITSLL